MKNKIYLALIMFTLTFSLFAVFDSGTGSSEDPFIISNAAQFNEIKNYLNSSFKLVDNIALSGYWIPVGSKEMPFTGNLDGNAKSVTGLHINDTLLDYASLFAYSSGAMIKNLSLSDVNINGRRFVSAFIAKSRNNTIIENCRVDGNISGIAYVSSIIAYSINSYVRNSYSSATLTGEINVAGLVAVNSFESSDGLVYVEGGTFSPDYGNFTVTLSPFYVGKYEVTQSEWYEVMTGNNNNIFAVPNGPWGYPGIGENYPMYYVSWYDILVYCNRRSYMEGLTPVYAKNGETNTDNWGVVPVDNNSEWNAITMDLSADSYRLPTEMEWMFAASGGVPALEAGKFNNDFSGSNTLGDVAWYNENNSPNGTKPVGTKAPNELGLYDMSGNVWEWCWDWYSTYPAGTYINPVGQNEGTSRTVRGGCWNINSYYATVVYRYFLYPQYYLDNLGFRVVRSVID